MVRCNDVHGHANALVLAFHRAPGNPPAAPMPDSPNLLALLKQYFGFETFRPLQEEIIRDALAGRDVLALQVGPVWTAFSFAVDSKHV